MANVLANSCLLCHPADTEQHEYPDQYKSAVLLLARLSFTLAVCRLVWDGLLEMAACGFV